MTTRPDLKLIEPPGDLPEYPLSRDVRMPTHYYIEWWHNRWLNSGLFLKGSYEVQGVAFALFNIAQNQSPMGTLPNDDEMLAKLLRLELRAWLDLRRMTISPLHNWYLCNCEGEVRWAHPVVLERLMSAKERRDERDLSKDERAVSKRIERLRKALLEMGCSQALVDDRVLVEEMDAWLEETWKKRRNAMAYGRALRWATEKGLVGRRM